jgi:mono/diheme cytochrome c family protein
MIKLLIASLSTLVLMVPLGTEAAVPDNQLFARGAYLAKVGDCVACHSASNGKPYAGGLPMTTPMGKIYTTNITPDAETGIGKWTEEDFEKALRRGISKDGHNLYPAMPYPSYAKVRDDDVAALYVYFMKSVAPVKQANRPSEIPFPLNMRWPLTFWNMIFLDKAVYQEKDGKDASWNRGAYLIQGLGHCGSCHTPRGVAFQEEAQDESKSAWLTGGALDGWFAANLTGEPNVGLGRWSTTDLDAFLKTGANAHASAFGSMTDVVNNSTQDVTDQDVAAMSTYLKWLPAAGGTNSSTYTYDPKYSKSLLAHPATDAGAKVYTAYCMHCHGVDGKAFAPFLAPLAGNPNVLEHDASSLINVTLNGTHDLVIQGIPAAYPMPKFSTVLNNQQIADVLTFVRGGWGNRAQPVSQEEVAKLRASTQAER